MSPDDQTNLDNWLGWVEDKAKKGQWYVKGEHAVRDIAARLGPDIEKEMELKLDELKAQAKAVRDAEGDKSHASIKMDIAAVRTFMEKNDHASAQKRIVTARDKAFKFLYTEEFEDELKDLYKENVTAAFQTEAAKELIAAGELAYSKGWTLSDEETGTVRKAVEAVLDNDQFKPPSELTSIAVHLEQCLEWAHWLA